MALNCYAGLTTLKSRLRLTSTSDDVALLSLIEMASRSIDDDTGRFFYTRTATEYIDGTGGGVLLVPFDLLSVTTLLEDSEGDGTFDGTAWTENTDFWLHPRGRYPAWGLVEHTNGRYGFSEYGNRYALTGVWGYGDGAGATPWAALSITATVATTGGTTLTISGVTGLEVGHTIRVGSEQMFVSAVTDSTTDTATVTRAVNGTTATTHTGATIYVAQYPPAISQEAIVRASGLYRVMGGDMSLLSEGIGDYRYQRFAPEQARAQEQSRVSNYVRF